MGTFIFCRPDPRSYLTVCVLLSHECSDGKYGNGSVFPDRVSDHLMYLCDPLLPYDLKA